MPTMQKAEKCTVNIRSSNIRTNVSYFVLKQDMENGAGKNETRNEACRIGIHEHLEC